MEEIYATKLYWAILRSIEERKYLIVWGFSSLHII
jgi:hypothetical protein